MAKYKSTPKLFIALIVVGILLLVGTTLFALSQNSALQGHAALPTYTSLAIKGNIFLDTNKNGVKDTGEVNYTSTPLPMVKVALLSQICPSTTPPSTTVTPTVTGVPSTTPPANCHYVTMCPQIACRQGTPCPTCTPKWVCVTPGAGSGTVGAGGVIQVTPGQIQVIQGKDVKAAETGPSGKGVGDVVGQGQDQSGSDVCRELPQRILNCTVSSDGTYLCSGQNLPPFTSAVVTAGAPTAYWKVTSKNPVVVSAAAASVDFGLAPSGIVGGQGASDQGLSSGTKQAFTIHVNGVVSGLPVVMYISEGKPNPDSALTGVFTTDASGNIQVKVTPNDVLTIVPVTSKGYTSITPNRLQVTVSKDSCGLDTPCEFVATP